MKQQIVSNDAPKADAILSQAVVSNGFIFVSGQVHSRPGGTLVEGSPKEKLDQIMQNIAAILKEADTTMDDIVKVVIYVTDMAIMAEVNEEYPKYFKPLLPAREAVCVKALPLGAH